VPLPYEYFYDPSQSNLIAGGDSLVYEYNFTIPACLQLFDVTNTAPRGFYQQAGTIYWLSVTAYATNGSFGWKTCVPYQHYNDDASWSPTLFGPHWSDLHYPPGHQYYPQSMDMAFALDNAVTIPTALRPSSEVVPVSPLLSATVSGSRLSISWLGGGILQYADQVTGPWHDIDGAGSPYETSTDTPQRFYRVRLP
jgi:hypothetical protein